MYWLCYNPSSPQHGDFSVAVAGVSFPSYFFSDWDLFGDWEAFIC